MGGIKNFQPVQTCFFPGGKVPHALPLSIALAIASGVTPEKGLITAIVAGFIISLFGGGKSQSQKIVNLGRKKHHGNPAGKSGCHGVGNEFNKTAEFAHPHKN